MPTTKIGERLERLLEESKYRGNAKALSLDAGLGETAVRDIIEGRSKKPRPDTLARIARGLNLPLADLLESNDADPDLASSAYAGGEAAPAPKPRISRRPNGAHDMIPIRSAGRGGKDQEMFVGVVGYTPRPAVLDGVREAYAIYMVGDSMEPRYEQGWLLHVNPFRPPNRGRTVVVYKRDHSVLVKRFLQRTATAIVLEQLNPREEIRIPHEEVLEMHLIVGTNEEGG